VQKARHFVARFTRNYLLQAPGYAHLYFVKSRNWLHGYISLFYHRIIRRIIGLLNLIATRTVGYAKIAAWQVLIGIPRRSRGRVALFYHREVKYGLGMIDLAVRKSAGYAKIAAWQVLIGIPRKIRGRVTLFYRREIPPWDN